MTAGTSPPCWAPTIRQHVAGRQHREILDMYLVGPEAAEYQHTDVAAALEALGVPVPLADVVAHRTGRCACRKGNR